MVGPVSLFRASINQALSAKREVDTPTQRALMKEWKKEVRRILRTAERAEQRGYAFDFSKMRLEPPRVLNSQSLGRIRKIRGDVVYGYAYKVDPDTGEFVKGKEARRLERSKAAKKGAATRKAKVGGLKGFAPGEGVREAEPPRLNWDRVVIDNFLDEMRASEGRGAQMLAEWVSNWADEVGDAKAAELVEELVESGGVGRSERYSEAAAVKVAVGAIRSLRDRGAITSVQFDRLYAAVDGQGYYEDFDGGDELYGFVTGRR